MKAEPAPEGPVSRKIKREYKKKSCCRAKTLRQLFWRSGLGFVVVLPAQALPQSVQGEVTAAVVHPGEGQA